MISLLLILSSLVFSQKAKQENIDCNCKNTSITEFCLSSGEYKVKVYSGQNNSPDLFHTSLFLNVCKAETANKIEVSNDHNILSADFAISSSLSLCYVFSLAGAGEKSNYTYSDSELKLEDLLKAKSPNLTLKDPKINSSVYKTNSLKEDCTFEYVTPNQQYIDGDFFKFRIK